MASGPIHGPGAVGRIRALLAARLSAAGPGGTPIAAVFLLAVVVGALCAMVSDHLPPFAYGVLSISLACALVAIPLLGELGHLLRADEAGEWSGALPLRPHELEIARTLHLLIVLGMLTAGALLPAVLFAPEETDWVARLAIPLLGTGLAGCFAATLLALQALFGGRAEALLILVQTALVVGTVVGLVAGLRFIPQLAQLPHLGDAGADFLWLVPPAWFAAPLATAEGEPARLWLPLTATALALGVLVLLPAPKARSASGEPLLARLLTPARRLTTRLFVRADERAPFDLVYDALPREREVVLRTYPMIGIPLAFLLVGASDGEAGREDLLALLFFTAGIYLPILLSQVAASESWRASHLLRTAALTPGTEASAVVKALAVRFLLPLYVLLMILAWTLEGPGIALRLGPAGFCASLIVMQRLYTTVVRDAPLSVAPDQVKTNQDWLGLLGGWAALLTIGAVVANRFAQEALPAAAIVLVLAGLAFASQRSLRALA